MLQLNLHIGVPTSVAGVAHLVEALFFFLQNLQVACSIPILSNSCFYIFASSNNQDEGSLFIPIKCRSLYTHKTNMSNFLNKYCMVWLDFGPNNIILLCGIFACADRYVHSMPFQFDDCIY